MIGFYIFLAILALVACLVLVICLPPRLRERYLREIREEIILTSYNYKKLVDVIDEMGFHKDIKNVYIFREYVSSKSKFDKFNFDLYFKSKISGNLENVDTLVNKVKQNKEKYDEFQKVYSDIYFSVPRGSNKKEVEYYDMERKILLECRDAIADNPVFVCCVNYTSPQGRNNYDNKKTYTFQQLIDMRDSVISENEEKKSEAYRRKFERGKMTDSLRYDVMERDEFRCRLCGRSAAQGAVLEVDHIMPISKGGKTTMSNLQTLCKECNRGKRDKYSDKSVNCECEEESNI